MTDATKSGLAARCWARFCGLGAAHQAVAALVAASQMKRLNPGKLLVEEGDQDDTLYLVVSGTLRTVRHTENGHEIWFSDIGAGEIVGEIAALTGASRTSSCVAKGDVGVLAIERDAFISAGEQHPEVGMALARMLAKRLGATSTQVADLVALSVPNRLLGELMRMGTQTKDDSELFLIASPPTVAALGQRIHATREATSRALGVLQNRGLVRRVDNGLVVLIPTGTPIGPLA
jgi:CRP-like cAMP-binding protein